MTVTKDELLARSSRNMRGVDDHIATWGRMIVSRVYDEGIFAQITEGFRSLERQAHLYGQGRPGYHFEGKAYGRRGKVVTNARPGQSIHNYGFALDFCLVSENGQQAIWQVNDEWRRVVSVAKGLGFTWGGNWTGFQDYPHIEWTHGMNWEEIAAGKSPFDYPGFLIRRGSRGKRVKQTQVATGARPDGIFGKKTEEAVRRFQQRKGIGIDGIVGLQTWGKFYN